MHTSCELFHRLTGKDRSIVDSYGGFLFPRLPNKRTSDKGGPLRGGMRVDPIWSRYPGQPQKSFGEQLVTRQKERIRIASGHPDAKLFAHEGNRMQEPRTMESFDQVEHQVEPMGLKKAGNVQQIAIKSFCSYRVTKPGQCGFDLCKLDQCILFIRRSLGSYRIMQ